MYTLEERIEQPQANKETQGTGKKKKKKRKKVNCQNENMPPHEEQNDEINHQNSTSTSFDEVGRSSTQVTGCERKTAGMDVKESVKCESLAVQPSIDAQTGKGTIPSYKHSSLLDFDTLGDHGQQDISMDTPDEDSLTPSAEALSAALHASALSLNDSDGRFLLTVDQTDEFSSEKCGNKSTQKPSIENESASTVTELKLTLSVCATDYNSEGSGDYNPSSAASNIGVVDSKDTTGSQLSKLCKDKTKQVSDSNDREMDSRAEKNIDKTDFDPFPSNIVNSDVSFVGVDEILPSTSEGSSHSVVTDGKGNACYDTLQGNSCRINMKNNCDDVTVGDRLLVKDEEDIVMNEQKQEFTKMEHNDQLYNLVRGDCSKGSREIGQNTESPSNSATTLQTVSIFSESKTVMTKDSEKKGEKCDFIEDGILPDKSDSTEEIALVGSGKEKSEDDTTETYLEHSSIREERPSTQGFTLHSVTVPCSALNYTQQVERKSMENNIEVVRNEDQTQNVRFNALLQGDACDEEKSLNNLHEVSLRLTVDSDTCEDIQRPLKLFCTDNKTDSSCGALTFSGENPLFRNEEGVVSSLICVDGTSEIEGDPSLDRAASRTSVASDQLETSPIEALKIPTTVTNNVGMRDEENRLFDFEAPEVVNYVPDENKINLGRQHKETEAVLIDVESAALMSNSDEILSQGGSLRSSVDCLVSNSEGLYLGSSDCDQTTVENSSGVCIIEPCRNVDESPDDRKSEILQPAQSEPFSPCCGDVKVATLCSDTIEASDMSVTLDMTRERNSLRTKAFDASGDRDSVTVSLEGSIESAFNNPLKVPGKENNAKNEPFSELFKNHSNSSEMKTEDDHSSVEGTCGDCRKVTVTEDNKLQNNELLQNTFFVSKDKASEVEKEEGEIGSDEVDMSQTKSRETEEEKTLDAQKTRSEDNEETPKDKSKETLKTGKLREEEKEEGELSSSDSDAEVFVKIADAQKGGPSTSKSKLFGDRTVASAVDKQPHPARRHSSGEGHHTLPMERSRLLASLGGKRRGSSSAIANADLRTRLSEIRSQRTSCGNAKSGAPRFEESVKECGGTEKPSKKVKEKVPHCGKNGEGKVKGGRNVEVKDSRLKTSEAQNNSTKTGSFKEDNHLGGLSKKDQLRQTPQSSMKAPKKSQGSSPCNKNSKTENTGRNKAERHPDNVQRTAAESDGKNRLKTSQPESGRKTKGTRKTSTHSEDSAAVVTKDVKKDSTGLHKPKSHADMAKESTSENALKTTQPESRPKTSTCELNAENNSSDSKKTGLKGKTGGRTLRSGGTPKSASDSSIERPSKRHSMNKATLKEQATVVGHLMPTAKGTVKGCRQVYRSCGKQTTSESKKLSKVKDGKRLAATDGNVSKVEYNEKGELQSVKVPSRTAPRKVSNKCLINVTSKVKANPQRGMETGTQNPRKRGRSVDSTETKHGKKMRIGEVKASLPKPSTVSSTHKLPKESKRIANCTSNSVKVPSCSDINVEGSRKVPANMENFKQTLEHKREGDSKADDSIQAKAISIGGNKCLVFKRRHVNQLFVRGDNVVMVAYAK